MIIKGSANASFNELECKNYSIQKKVQPSCKQKSRKKIQNKLERGSGGGGGGQGKKMRAG